MHGLSPTELLEVWEQGAERGAIERGLLLLSRCLPDCAWPELAAIPIGRRNVLLLELRAATFGEAMSCFAVCPACSGQLEFEIAPRQMGLTFAEKGNNVLQLESGGEAIPFRLPDSTDLYAAQVSRDVEEARRAITTRCVEWSGAELPMEIIDAFEARLAEADPAAEISLNLNCPSCGHAWELALDVVSFFWREIQSAARRVVLEVDALARAYGWSEAAILGMSSARRNLYLELVG